MKTLQERIAQFEQQPALALDLEQLKDWASQELRENKPIGKERRGNILADIYAPTEGKGQFIGHKRQAKHPDIYHRPPKPDARLMRKAANEPIQGDIRKVRETGYKVRRKGQDIKSVTYRPKPKQSQVDATALAALFAERRKAKQNLGSFG